MHSLCYCGASIYLQEDLLDNLGHYIDLLASESHYFVIDPSGTKLMDKVYDGKVVAAVIAVLLKSIRVPFAL